MNSIIPETRRIFYSIETPRANCDSIIDNYKEACRRYTKHNAKYPGQARLVEIEKITKRRVIPPSEIEKELEKDKPRGTTF